MSLNLIKGAKAGHGLPIFPLGVNIDPLVFTIPTLGLHVTGNSGITKVPHEVVAWLYAKSFQVEMTVAAGSSSVFVFKTLNVGETLVVNSGGDSTTGEAIDSIHKAITLDDFDSPSYSTDTRLVWSLLEGTVGLSLSIIINTLAATGDSRPTYYNKLTSGDDAWKLPIAISGLLSTYDEDDAIVDQWGFNATAPEDGIQDDFTFCGVPIKMGVSEGLSVTGNISVSEWLPMYPSPD